MSDPTKTALLNFFSGHLDRIYCGKEHLISSLPALAEKAHFGDLKLAIMELRDDVRNQLDRMNEVYLILKAERNEAGCVGMRALLQEMFKGINSHEHEKSLCDLSLMFYLQNIEGIESASFQMLRLTAVNLGNEHVNQLLMENLDETREDRGLLMQISEKFMALKGLRTN